MNRNCRGLLVGLSIAVVTAGLLASCSSTPGPLSSAPEGVAIQNVPDLASADTTMTGGPVDGITCRTALQQKVRYHIHVHVEIYVDGLQKRIPAGAGIAAPRDNEHLATGLFVDNSFKGCLYWLHVHVNDGVIHVESPYKHTFNLGQFFDVWQQPLGPNQVGPAAGHVTAFENGKKYTGNPRDVPLVPQGVIQLDVGTPVVAYQPVQFTVTGLCGAGAQSCAAGG